MADDYQIEDSAVASLGRGCNRNIFRNPRGNKYWYSFYIETGDLFCEYSTDGQTWSNTRQTVYSGTGIDGFDFCIYDSGSDLKVFICYLDDTGSFNVLYYRRGSISDAGSTITWDSHVTVIANVDGLLNQNFQSLIARTYNGRLVIAFTEDENVGGNNYRQLRIIGSDGDGASPSWSNETVVDDVSGNTNNADKAGNRTGITGFGSSYPNRVFIFTKQPEPTTTSTFIMKVILYDWDGDTMSYVGESTPDTTGRTTYSIPYGVIDENEYVHISFEESTTLYHYKGISAGSASVGSANTIIDSDVQFQSIVADKENGTIYSIYVLVSDQYTVYYKTTPNDTISWGDANSKDLTEPATAFTACEIAIESAVHIQISTVDIDMWYLSIATPTGGPRQVALTRTSDGKFLFYNEKALVVI